ncbi:MAG: YfdQ family protein [Candidatus Arsenophonus phytopathogenicus]
MSQLDGTAISQIQNLTIAGIHLDPIKTTDCPVIVVPKNHEIRSLEALNLTRYRFRGVMKTISILDFVNYSTGYAQTASVRCFIDAETMTAKTIFNVGTLDEPGHADNQALVSLKKTSPFKSLLKIDGERQRQKQLAEWLEDWRDYLTAFDAEEDALDIKKAISAVRLITIEATHSSDHEDTDFSAKRSVLENVEAKSKDVMAAYFEFTCVPYDELSKRRIKLRYSILTGGEAPVFVRLIVQLENLEEKIAQEFSDLLSTYFIDSKIETFIGSFSAS